MLALIIDENLNHRILRGLQRAVPLLDCVVAQCVGLQGVEDRALLEWAAGQHRILVTHDLKTIPKHAYERIKAGKLMPGIVAVPDSMSIGQAIEDLTLLTECSKQKLFDYEDGRKVWDRFIRVEGDRYRLVIERQ